MGLSIASAPSRIGQSPRGAAEEALRWAIALGLGEAKSDRDIERLGDAGRSVGWARIAAASARERCLGATWLRSGALLRRTASEDVVAQWRRATVRLDEVGRVQLSSLSDALTALRAANVAVVVLKGAPLSLRAYGAPFLRDTSDVDLFIASRQRARAHAALREAGWRHIDGSAPDDATYVRERSGQRSFVEVHSSLADAPIVRHVHLPPPDASAIEIAGVAVPAHDGPTLAPYLAVHLAKHTSAPLLWVMDFDAVWNDLDDADRSRARVAARRAGAEGYLDLAIRRASALHAAARGDRRAQERCGGATGLYKERHAAIVGALAAPTPLVGARVLGGWLKRRIAALGKPRPWAVSGRLRWLDHAFAPMRRTGDTSARTSDIADRVLQLDVDTSLDVVRAMIDAGTSVWLVARGTSMSPTIRSGTQVLVAPRRETDDLLPGHVVLATARDGAPVMHRVRRVSDGRVVLRGDAMGVDDMPIDPRAIIGRVTHLRRGERIRSLGLRPAPSLRNAMRRVLRRSGPS